jgi:hypothetical protein
MLTAYFEHKSILHTVLRVNAAFSGLFGLVFSLFSGTFADWLGIPNPTAILVAGLLLIVWEVIIFQLVRQIHINPTSVWAVIVGDLAWVVGSIALLLGGWLPLTTAGLWFVAIVADIVLVFAIVQYIGLKKQANLA